MTNATQTTYEHFVRLVDAFGYAICRYTRNSNEENDKAYTDARASLLSAYPQQAKDEGREAALTDLAAKVERVAGWCSLVFKDHNSDLLRGGAIDLHAVARELRAMKGKAS